MRRATYAISDVALASAVPFPELDRHDADADWTFEVVTTPLAGGSPRWFHHWRTPNGRRTASFSRNALGYVIRFHGQADFAIDLAGRSIRCRPRRRDDDLATVRHLLLDQVLPLLLSRERRLVLHASAVASPRGAVAFAGPAGAGKSTLAAALASRGLPLLCDDCLVVEPSATGFHARSFYPGARLYADSVRAVGVARAGTSKLASYTRKRRIHGAHLPYHGRSAPLAALFILDGRPRRSRVRDTSLSPILRRDALMAVVGCTFHLDVEDTAIVRDTFDLQSRFVESTPVYRLKYPWRLDRLPSIHQAILRHLEACAR